MSDLNPHAKHMADESMVRNLDAQARAIWPQERELFARYRLPAGARILDAGCGTGEGASRLAELFADADVLGVDVLEAHLERARLRYAHLAPRLHFERQSVFELESESGQFDLTVCRHVLHSIPHVGRVLAELVRVTRPGGYLHLIPEDYGMLHFQAGSLDPSEFWSVAPRHFGPVSGTDLFIGRNIFTFLQDLELEEICAEYVVVDTLRVPRETFAAIIEAWRDGYADEIGALTPLQPEQARAYFDEMIACIRDPRRYAVWMVPVWSARVPPKRIS